jgi:hypothetical protein
MVNPTSRTLHIPANKPLGSVNFNLTKDLTSTPNILSHYHTDLDKSISFCTMNNDECPILAANQYVTPSICSKPVQRNSMPLWPTDSTPSHTLSHLNPNSDNNYYHHSYMNYGVIEPNHTYTSNTSDKFTAILEKYYKSDQDNMTATQIYDLKRRTFPYLPPDDLRLKMPDRVIIDKDLDLTTDSILTPKDRETVKNLFYSLRECLSTHDNPSIQNKAFISLNPVNLKPFYIKPYLTHDKEIKFAEKEMEKLRLMGILQRGSSQFLSPVMLIPKAHSGSKLSTSPEYRLVVDFKYLNSFLPDVKFS